MQLHQREHHSSEGARSIASCASSVTRVVAGAIVSLPSLLYHACTAGPRSPGYRVRQGISPRGRRPSVSQICNLPGSFWQPGSKTASTWRAHHISTQGRCTGVRILKHPTYRNSIVAMVKAAIGATKVCSLLCRSTCPCGDGVRITYPCGDIAPLWQHDED